MFSASSLLLKTIFSHSLSALVYLVLLLAFIISWVWNKITTSARDGPKEKFRGTMYLSTLICSLGASAFYLVMCILSYFYWYRNVFSEENVVSLLDLAFKTVVWGVFCAYLWKGCFNSSERQFPFYLRAWCVFNLVTSGYTFTLDTVLHVKHVFIPVQILISDGVSFFLAIYFCYVLILVKSESEDNNLQEPFLNDNANVSDCLEINTKGEDAVTPYLNAGLFSTLTFSWVGPLIAVGKQKILDLEDVPQLATCDSAAGAFPPFKNRLEAYCGTIENATTFELAKSLALSAWKEIFATGILALLNTLASYVGPYLIDTFVQYLNGKQTFKNEGYVLVAAFFLGKLVECLSQRHRLFKLQQIGVRIRAQLVTLIYSKSLTLSCHAKQSHTSGEIINFITVDAERVGNFSWYIHSLWLVVLKVVLALYILYKNLGWASIAAFVATVVVMLANVPGGRMLEKFQEKLMESKDRRMKSTSEILRNIRILKLQGWEMKFLSKIIELRKIEEDWLRKYVYTLAVTVFLFWSAPTFVSVATFGTCTLVGIPLESGKILSALATFQILQSAIYNLPDTISMIAQTKVSLDRIASFLRLEDLQSDVILKLPRVALIQQ